MIECPYLRVNDIIDGISCLSEPELRLILRLIEDRLSSPRQPDLQLTPDARNEEVDLRRQVLDKVSQIKSQLEVLNQRLDKLPIDKICSQFTALTHKIDKLLRKPRKIDRDTEIVLLRDNPDGKAKLPWPKVAKKLKELDPEWEMKVSAIRRAYYRQKSRMSSGQS